MKTIYYAIQNIIRGKDSTLIKVVSLSLGLFFSIVMFALVGVQLGFDSFYRDNEDIYVAETAWDSGKGLEYKNYFCIYPTAKTLMEHFPEQVESATVICEHAPRAVQLGKEHIRLHLIQSDSLFFQTMGVPLVEGNAIDLHAPDALFLSESSARRIFGSENPIGKTLRWQNKYELIVKGIFTDMPRNVTMYAEAVLSINHPWMLGGSMRTDWMGGGNYPTFVRLKKGADMDYINQRINSVVGNYLDSAGFYDSGSVKKIELSLTPLKGYNLQQAATKSMVITLSILGLILLLTAAFNYALISISSLSHRAKAIGVHKCNGAETPHIFRMFLYETLFLTGISVLIAIFLILNFREQIPTPFDSLFALNNLWAPGLAIVLIFVLGCVLPGRVFSSIPVTQVFRRYTEGKKRWKYPLLFVQFMGTAFLIGFVTVIYVQHQYVVNKDMGYDSDRVVFAMHRYENPNNAMSNVRNLPYVEGAEFSKVELLHFGGTVG
ncbi:MAG: ABC transporter permease, partial [Bacteroidaceae bacterium]|nr:ABC transporter permease [Bacteroidaceae bacterium]